MSIRDSGSRRLRCVAISMLAVSTLPAKTYAQSLTTPEAATLAPDVIADRLLGPGHEQIVRVSRPDARQMMFPVLGVQLYGKPVTASKDLCSANYYRVEMRGKNSAVGQPPVADVDTKKVSKIYGIRGTSRCEDLDPEKLFFYEGETTVQSAVILMQTLILNQKTVCHTADINCDVAPSNLLKLTLGQCKKIPADVCLVANFGPAREFLSHTVVTVRGHKRGESSAEILWDKPIFTVSYSLVY